MSRSSVSLLGRAPTYSTPAGHHIVDALLGAVADYRSLPPDARPHEPAHGPYNISKEAIEFTKQQLAKRDKEWNDHLISVGITPQAKL